ncbi:MAG: DnaJ domain-containing protein [Robiginitomaculum sp.]|nr:DnaJ domain-containing protein [Robiginitomaculum sp.]
MSDDFKYTPKLFDIRVKPPGKEKAGDADQKCEWDGCVAKGNCKAPQSPDSLNEYFWFCQKHTAEYNKAWNFFHGMSESAARSYQEGQVHGNRPTWDMRRSAPGQQAGVKGWQHRYADPLDLTGDAKFSEAQAPKRRLGRLQSLAMDDLGLAYDTEPKYVRTRYLKLVKTFHPDANKGDRSTEGRLQQVIRAYQILKTAKLA